MPRPHPRPWHRHSQFGDGPRRPLDRNQRARFAFLVDAHHRAGRITRAHRDIGRALLRRLGADGQCDPAYDTLGADAGCSARTARRATATMRDLGLLRWQTRLVRDGWRATQTSNQYLLLTTATAPDRCGGHSGRESRRPSISSCAEQANEADAIAARAALARAAAAMQRRLAARWQAAR